MSEVRLVQSPPEALRRARTSCAKGMIVVRVGRYLGDDVSEIEVFEDISNRVRTAARHGAVGFFFSPGPDLGTRGPVAADPFGPDQHLQSATFLAMAAALESGAAVRFLSEGFAAGGFAPLFERYRGQVSGQIRFVAGGGAGLDSLESRAASVESRLKTIENLSIAAGADSVIPRVDPVIPGLNDSEDSLGELLDAFVEVPCEKVVVAPLRFNPTWRKRLANALGDPVLQQIARHYTPGRSRRRTAPVPPGDRLPLDREATLSWRLRVAAEPRNLDLVFCRCREGQRGSCGLGLPIPTEQRRTPGRRQGDSQLELWAG